jgi:universal stress protein A
MTSGQPAHKHRGHDMTIRLQKILLPTDFSTYSAAATKYACELATKFDAELHLLHTLETHLASTPNFGLGLDLPKYVSESKAAADKSLAGVLDPKWSASRTIVMAIVEGSPKAEIIAYARKHNIDLIVLATHGRSGLAHVLMGSVAESIVRTAPCPVLTVRPEGHQFVMP